MTSTYPLETVAPWRRVGADEVKLLRDGEQAFPAMLAAIHAAQREILLEMYWVSADLVGTRFRDALTARARRGVRVKVIYDALGSMGIGPSFWTPLVEAGGVVREFHGFLHLAGTMALERLDQRDHRKVLVVDAEVGFTGGVNLSAPWLPIEEGGAGWRDDAIAVRGPVVGELRSVFYRTWRRISGEQLPPDVRPAPRVGGIVPRRPRARARPVWVLATHWRTRRSVYREYLVRIHRAQSRIDIANSYFVPDRHVLRALLRAAARGVRVRILLPSKSDVPIVQAAVEASFDRLLRNGIELFTLPGRMLHSKTAIIDGHFSTIGSYNLDHRSLRKNMELNIAVEDAAFASDVLAAFEVDIAAAHRVDLDTWRARPRLQRGIEWFARKLRRLW